ncbi:hypothetical protein TNCT_329511 [Trichonephila clavata]|uniref:Uncharacterized protein n=1 Tax=Trichonephila clavata TaxID=2740835 RepID=A0A8X6KLF0_TRICU|nr:hypothetical protein TNCT_329511 [Trichonephila clavata]
MYQMEEKHTISKKSKKGEGKTELCKYAHEKETCIPITTLILTAQYESQLTRLAKKAALKVYRTSLRWRESEINTNYADICVSDVNLALSSRRTSLILIFKGGCTIILEGNDRGRCAGVQK